MNENKQGWDNIAEQEKKHERKRKIFKFGNRLEFSLELVFSVVILLLVIIGLFFWITGG